MAQSLSAVQAVAPPPGRWPLAGQGRGGRLLGGPAHQSSQKSGVALSSRGSQRRAVRSRLPSQLTCLLPLLTAWKAGVSLSAR